MKLYDKIHSIWKRTERGLFIPWEWSTPELAYLAESEWLWTEKVDGTNIRIGLGRDTSQTGAITPLTYRIGGRTENAQIPTRLLDAIAGLDLEAKLREHFDGPVCLYGEGYGAKIQKGGGNYRPDQGFVLFDVTVGGWQLKRPDVEDVAQKLGLDVVPVRVHRGTLAYVIGEVSAEQGIRSRWGDFRAEGLVGTPTVPLYDRKGKRIIVKVKSKDFDRLRKEGVTW